MATHRSDDESSPLISGTRSSGTRRGASTSSDHFTGRGQKLLVTLCILVTELCERLTFYGVAANLVLFSSSELGLKSPWPSTINYLFIGTCYIVPLLGGWLADAHLGRYNTIYASALLYVVGVILLSAVSIQNDMLQSLTFRGESIVHNETWRLIYFVIALGMIAFGTGGIKANVSPFGADQIQQDGPRAVQTFFNWFFGFITIGSLIAYTVVVYVQQKNVFYGYCITAGAIFLAVITFVSGRNKYVDKPPSGGQLTETAQIIYRAVKNRGTTNVNMWLDKAKIRFGGKYTEAQVEDVKALLRVIPVFILFIAYWTVYTQVLTTFVIQATYMKLKFESFTMPAAAPFLTYLVTLLLFIPIMDRVVYPLVEHCGFRLTPLRRIGVGMLLAAASVGVAGVIEIKRRDVWENGGTCHQVVFGEPRNASSLNVFWQAPQFILMGSSEVLAIVTGLEFTYSQSPKHMKGLVMGVFLVTTALGSYVASLLVIIVRSASNSKWYPSDNPNEGTMEYFFFLLAGLMMLNFVVFLFVASSYKYRTALKKEEITPNNRDTAVHT